MMEVTISPTWCIALNFMTWTTGSVVEIQWTDFLKHSPQGFSLNFWGGGELNFFRPLWSPWGTKSMGGGDLKKIYPSPGIKPCSFYVLEKQKRGLLIDINVSESHEIAATRMSLYSYNIGLLWFTNGMTQMANSLLTSQPQIDLHNASPSLKE